MQARQDTRLSDLASRPLVRATGPVPMRAWSCARLHQKSPTNGGVGGSCPTERPPPSQAKPDARAVRTCFPRVSRIAEAA